MALYYTGDKLQFFVTRSSAVSLFRCTFYHLVQFICGEEWCSFSFFSRRFWLCFAIDSSISGLVQKIKNKNTKLVYSRKCWGSFFWCSAVVFLHFWQTHIHMCINITDIRLHTFYFIVFCMHFCIRCKFIRFLLLSAHRTRCWWWNGYTVWFGRLCVVLIFYIYFSPLSAAVVGVSRVEKVHFVYVRIFSMMVVCVGGKWSFGIIEVSQKYFNGLCCRDSG